MKKFVSLLLIVLLLSCFGGTAYAAEAQNGQGESKVNEQDADRQGFYVVIESYLNAVAQSLSLDSTDVSFLDIDIPNKQCQIHRNIV